MKKCNCGAVKKDGIIVHKRTCGKGADDWTKNEIFAVENHTCEHPDGLSFEHVMELIEQGSDKVTIWEPFEYEPGESICEKINDMVTNLDRTYPGGAK